MNQAEGRRSNFVANLVLWVETVGLLALIVMPPIVMASACEPDRGSVRVAGLFACAVVLYWTLLAIACLLVSVLRELRRLHELLSGREGNA
jgi:hypothetical protein